MKKSALFFCLLAGIIARTQQPQVPGQALFVQGYRYMNGNGTAYDPVKAASLFRQSAAAGNPQAMNAMGNLYLNQISAPNADSAIYCYKQAAGKGYPSAYYNLGRLYQTGEGVQQNFTEAAKYYQAGAAAGDNSCKNELAYFYYKGFGVAQSYANAFTLYSQLALQGDKNAQYFTGLCYRNGYGTTPDKDLARTWLAKAAANGEGQAVHELTEEPQPENAYLETPGLQQQVQKLQGYNEQFVASGSNDISGKYKGYAVYYDFSRQYAAAVVPLKLDIQKNGTQYTGTWTESDSLAAPVTASFNNNVFSFDSSCKYIRHNHYSDRNAEAYLFNKATLGIKYVNDSMCLAGDVQFYSLTRKEPGQPMYIAVSKANSNALTGLAEMELTLSPNPANAQIKAGFALKKAANVQILITDIKGTVVQLTGTEALPAGTYSRDFDIQSFAAGTYVLRLKTGSKTESKIFVKL